MPTSGDNKIEKPSLVVPRPNGLNVPQVDFDSARFLLNMNHAKRALGRATEMEEAGDYVGVFAEMNAVAENVRTMANLAFWATRPFAPTPADRAVPP